MKHSDTPNAKEQNMKNHSLFITLWKHWPSMDYFCVIDVPQLKNSLNSHTPPYVNRYYLITKHLSSNFKFPNHPHLYYNFIFHHYMNKHYLLQSLTCILHTI